MPLTCDCDLIDTGQIYYTEGPDEFSILDTMQSRKCVNCGIKIKLGSIVTTHLRFKTPKHDVEVAIYGEDGEIACASEFLCEDCSDMYFNLKDRGYCIRPWEVTECLNAYIDLTYTGNVRSI